MTALKWITTEAKKLKKQYPKRFATWREYVAQASAIYAAKHKGKSPVGKKKTVSGVKKKVGALPIGFTGSFWGVKFKIINQFDIYGEVNSIVEDLENGVTIIVFDGKKSTKELTETFSSYIIKHRNFLYSYGENDVRDLKKRINRFCIDMQKEVKDYNAGKKKTIKKQPIKIEPPKQKKRIKKQPVTKKRINTNWKKVRSHERRVNGLHKDTKSHNVRISVVSGVEKDINRTIEQLKKLQTDLKIAEQNYKKSKDQFTKFYTKQKVDRLKYELRERKFVLTNLYKNIKKSI